MSPAVRFTPVISNVFGPAVVPTQEPLNELSAEADKTAGGGAEVINDLSTP